MMSYPILLGGCSSFWRLRLRRPQLRTQAWRRRQQRQRQQVRTNFLARDFGRLGRHVDGHGARPLSSRHGPSCPTRRTSGCWYTKGQSHHDRRGGRGSSRRTSGMHIVTACACAAPQCQKMLNALLCLLAHTMTCSHARSCNAGAWLWLAAAQADHQARRFPPPR